MGLTIDNFGSKFLCESKMFTVSILLSHCIGIDWIGVIHFFIYLQGMLSKTSLPMDTMDQAIRAALHPWLRYIPQIKVHYVWFILQHIYIYIYAGLFLLGWAAWYIAKSKMQSPKCEKNNKVFSYLNEPHNQTQIWSSPSGYVVLHCDIYLYISMCQMWLHWNKICETNVYREWCFSDSLASQPI